MVNFSGNSSECRTLHHVIRLLVVRYSREILSRHYYNHQIISKSNAYRFSLFTIIIYEGSHCRTSFFGNMETFSLSSSQQHANISLNEELQLLHSFLLRHQKCA
mmetsp:Transcript_22810/g.48255  ORF Transcript_22810/g.48255 Transcript_22810/m.48255 type:complete len:104 (+) Transcript_22810:103-414(+)